MLTTPISPGCLGVQPASPGHCPASLRSAFRRSDRLSFPPSARWAAMVSAGLESRLSVLHHLLHFNIFVTSVSLSFSLFVLAPGRQLARGLHRLGPLVAVRASFQARCLVLLVAVVLPTQWTQTHQVAGKSRKELGPFTAILARQGGTIGRFDWLWFTRGKAGSIQQFPVDA